MRSLRQFVLMSDGQSEARTTAEDDYIVQGGGPVDRRCSIEALGTGNVRWNNRSPYSDDLRSTYH